MSEIDLLYEDSPIRGQKYMVFSYIIPKESMYKENVPDELTPMVKFRGAFPTKEDAQKRSQEVHSEEPYVTVFIGEVGKWTSLVDESKLDLDPFMNNVESKMQELIQYQRDTKKTKDEKFGDYIAQMKKRAEYELSEEGKKDTKFIEEQKEIVEEQIKSLQKQVGEYAKRIDKIKSGNLDEFVDE